MLAIPGQPADPHTIAWGSPGIPHLQEPPVTIFAGVKDESTYNNHAYLEFFDGKFWAMWSTHPTNGNFHGMTVVYSTSVDGTKWSAPGPITTIPAGKRYVARGFWSRNGKLLALASFDSGQPKSQKYWAAPDLELQAFEWNPKTAKWSLLGVAYKDAINNFPPKKLPGGQWMMARRDYQFRLTLMTGGVAGFDRWAISEVPNPEDRSFNEPDVVVRADGSVAMHIRDNSRSKWLYRSVSKDGGLTWSVPEQTNFPDATSKNFNLRLSNGLYVLVSNPSPNSRVPLTVGTSRDGATYDRIAIVDDTPGGPRIPGVDKGPGYTYPHAIEHGGYLYVIYSRHRDDIVVRRVKIGDLAKLPAPSWGMKQ
ncbi:MAG: exo-alpha-sialidase [Acidobacteriota bacterium]